MKIFQESKSIFIFFSLIILFIISRIIVFEACEKYNNKQDIKNFAAYSYGYYKAKEHNLDFYTYYIELKKKRGLNNAPGECTFEYPPMIFSFSLIPSWFIWNKDFKTLSGQQNYFTSYTFNYRILCFSVELLIFILLLSISLQDGKTFIRKICPGLFFILINFFQPVTIYDRADLILGALLFLSVYFFFKRRNYLLSYFFLSVAVCFKLTPIILIPVWIIFSIKPQEIKSRAALLKSITLKASAFLLMISVMTLLYLLLYGKSCLGFIKYHILRPLQLETVYANILQLYYLYTNTDFISFSNYGSLNIQSLNSYDITIISLILLIILFIIYAAVFIKIRKELNLSSLEYFILVNKKELFLQTLILIITTSIIFSKVFSPQYLLWVTILLPLLLLYRQKDGSVLIYFLFLPICILSSNLLMNYQLLEFKTTAGITILTIRNFLFLFASALLLKDFIKSLIKK